MIHEIRTLDACKLFLLIGVAAGAVGQAPPAAPRTEFEVVSIKPSAGNDGRSFVQLLPGGGLRVSGATLEGLLTSAYEVRFFQISGGPGWIKSDRFDVVAKADLSASLENATGDLSQVTPTEYQTRQKLMRPRLQALLADRFRLSFHRETKEAPVYNLVVGKDGTKLKRSGEFRGLRVGESQLTGAGATLEMLTTALSGRLERPVLDRTGLKGEFDFKLEWAPDAGQAIGASPVVSDKPSLFGALQEQLGLRLEPARGAVEILVIDHVEKPSSN